MKTNKKNHIKQNSIIRYNTNNTKKLHEMNEKTHNGHNSGVEARLLF